MQNRFLKSACGVLIVCGLGLEMQTVMADPPATQPAASQPATTGPATITWDQAAAHVGETVTVTGPVMGTHVTTGTKALVLNIGKDFPDPKRFSIMIKTDEQTPALPATYEGKTVTVTGKIELFKKVPEIKAVPADVSIEE